MKDVNPGECSCLIRDKYKKEPSCKNICIQVLPDKQHPGEMCFHVCSGLRLIE